MEGTVDAFGELAGSGRTPLLMRNKWMDGYVSRCLFSLLEE